MGEDIRGSQKAIAELIKKRAAISVSEMADIAVLAEKAGGALTAVSASDDDDGCGTGRLRFKWPPPKRTELLSVLEGLVERHIGFEVLINGIPVPDEVLVNISRTYGR